MTTGDDSNRFEEAIVATAAERDVDGETLTELVADHQRAVADLPGVENLAYEWRKHYEDPLLRRTADAYFVCVPDWVWSEFADRLDVTDSRVDALKAVHRLAVVAHTDAARTPPDGDTYVVLDRTADD